jgi:hypothetical protein
MIGVFIAAPLEFEGLVEPLAIGAIREAGTHPDRGAVFWRIEGPALVVETYLSIARSVITSLSAIP